MIKMVREPLWSVESGEGLENLGRNISGGKYWRKAETDIFIKDFRKAFIRL